MTDALPHTGRLAGIDYGTVRIGVAICDASQTWASPLENYNRRTLELDAKWLSQLAKQEQIVGFVVGLPIHTSGEESQKSAEARKFAAWISQTTSLPIQLFDERFTSQHAEALLIDAGLTSKQRKARLDKLAAQVLLSAYLESNRSATPPAAMDDLPL
jgi:putative Holliday junction resolvase